MIDLPADFDVLLVDGAVVDGSGAAPRRADVGVRGGAIAAVGDLARASARRVLDCAGLCVAPGFIDVHSHSDVYALVRPDAPSKIRQGVTTEIVGQCGASAAPLVGGAALPSDWAAHPCPRPWRTMREYREALAARDPLVHVVCLTGHRNLRMAVMGLDARPATADETARMTRLLADSLAEGSAGLSTGLLYQPACHALPEEVRALAAECARQGGRYATHLRSEGARLLEALDEALDTARATGVALQISHFKTSGRANWHKLEDAIARLEAARAEGVRVHADRYPYTAAGTELDVILPEWAERGARADILGRLADPATRRRIADEMTAEREPGYWATVMVGGTWCAANAPLRGRDIASIADAWRCPPAEAVLRIVEADALRTGAFFFGMSEANLRRIYSLPWVMVGSDASLRAPEGALSDDHPHPRAYGTFPRFLALCRDEGLMPLGEAVRRLASLPAQAFGLKDRGLVRTGGVADLCVFDPAAVKDAATFAEPHRFPAGIRHVLAAGRVAF